MIYELINPSDKATLEAPSLAVAAFAALALSPRYGVKNVDDPDDKFFEFFHSLAAFRNRWGDDQEFLRTHHDAIAASLESVLLLGAEARKQYQRALELIDDPEKRRQYRDEVEDRRRSSIRAICQHAWSLAERMRADAAYIEQQIGRK